MSPHNRHSAVALALLTAFLLPASARAAKVEAWRHDSPSAFAKARKHRVVVSDAGRVRLARALKTAGTLDAARVWDLARTADGTVYAATGDGGQVFRRAERGTWSLIHDGDDTQALSLAALPDGRVFAGMGPSGQVVEVTDPEQPATRPDPSVQYVWDLAADAQGNLFAATGPNGGLWKRSAEGVWSLVLDGKHPHLLCVAVGPDGTVYAGSDGEGLIYRVDQAGRVSVLYDAPQNEVRALLVADGAVFAGTAAESGGGSSGGGTARGLAARAEAPERSPSDPATAATPRANVPEVKGEAKAAGSAGGTAAPRSPSPGENAVYRIGPDGAPREVFRAKTLIFALAWQQGRLLVGTGPDGVLYEVRQRESAPIARLDHGQVLALLPEPEGGLLLGAGDPGAVLALGAGYVPSGQLISDVLDARLVSRVGAWSWTADVPDGTRQSLAVRTGNVAEPDGTWSAWSPERNAPGTAAPVPPGRFAQYRLTLGSDRPDATPELRSVALYYQTLNLPPEIAKITVPDLTAADGASRQTRLTLKWDASDPNGDDLDYTLHVCKEGWPDWVKLGDAPLTSRSFEWDTTAVPAGIYRLRVTGDDRPSNAPGDALSRSLISEPFLVDHQAPTVRVEVGDDRSTILLKDDWARLVRADYALDGGPWTPIFPDDGLFDTTRETIALTLPSLKPGTHVLMLRATDAAGNTGTGDAVFQRP